MRRLKKTTPGSLNVNRAVVSIQATLAPEIAFVLLDDTHHRPARTDFLLNTRGKLGTAERLRDRGTLFRRTCGALSGLFKKKTTSSALFFGRTKK